MLKSMKQLKEETNAKLSERKLHHDDEGRVIIDINIRDDNDFLSSYSLSNRPLINGNVAEFLDSATSFYLPKDQFRLRIHSNCIDENEKKIYPAAISEYYSRAYVENERIIRRNYILSLVLGIFGVFLLSFMITLEVMKSSVIAIEVIDIAAWVFLWECFDIAFLENRMLKIKRMRYLALQHLQVEFTSLDTNFTK